MFCLCLIIIAVYFIPLLNNFDILIIQLKSSSSLIQPLLDLTSIIQCDPYSCIKICLPRLNLMTSLGSTCYVVFPEDHTINRATLFDGTNFTYWKARMKFFLLPIYYDVWNMQNLVIMNPLLLEDQVVTRPRDRWDATIKRFSIQILKP